MKYLATIIISVALNLAHATENIAYQNWAVNIGEEKNEAYTIVDPNTSFGVFCGGDQCLFYLHQGFNCTPGTKYSVLMNSSTISTALTMECTLIRGNLFQILTPFNEVLQAIQVGGTIGFAIALQSGAFAVTRFSLQGSKLAVDRVLTQAATKKNSEHSLAPKQLPPPAKSMPALPKLPQPSSKDIST